MIAQELVRKSLSMKGKTLKNINAVFNTRIGKLLLNPVNAIGDRE